MYVGKTEQVTFSDFNSSRCEINLILVNDNRELREFRIAKAFMFFHDFSAARSLLHWCFPSRERRWPGTGWLYIRALWRNAPFVVVRKLPRRRTVTFSRERVLSEVESCERSWTIAFHARFLLARRVGRFPPCVSSWIASTNFTRAQLRRRIVN